MSDTNTNPKITKTDEEWRGELDPAAYEVLRQQATEHPWTGRYVDEKGDGVYRCAGCGNALFASDTKFESGSGWPSFTDPMFSEAVDTHTDSSFGMVRTEVTCARCGGHLGHVFDDGPRDRGGLRYCINSCALDLERSDSS
jgi:peptide-methionine (R)-S-oxide reductase